MKKQNKSVFSSIKQGLDEAIQYEKTKSSKFGRSVVVQFTPVPHYTSDEVKKIRQKLELTQKSFAFLMGVSLKTVEAWEAGTNEPNGTARRMLSLLNKEKNLVKKFELVGLK